MPTRHSGFLIQSAFGTKGHFELVVPGRTGGLVHCWRNNDAAGLPWAGAVSFGSGEVAAVSLIQSNFGSGPGSFEVVARVGGLLVHYWREDTPPYRWHGPIDIAFGAAGNPALIQGRYGQKGDFELIVPRAAGGIDHYFRDNDSGVAWKGPTTFATDVGKVDAVALLQSNFGNPGNLEAVVRVGTKLAHFWRQSGPPFAWQGPNWFFDGAAGVPSFLQSKHGARGNFELVTPLAPPTHGMAHLWRNNDDPGLPWTAPDQFGQSVGAVSAVSVLQSNFGPIGHLEVVARVGERSAYFWRDDLPPFAWTGPTAYACEEPACQPATQGEWRVPFQSGVVGVHAALLHTGKVLFYSYKEHENHNLGASAVLDPENGQVTLLPDTENLFCSGLAALPDGRIVVAGGHHTGVKSLHLFTPAGPAGSWNKVGSLANGRWYPTCTTLANGQVLILSGVTGTGPPVPGKPINATYELYDSKSGLMAPKPAAFLPNEVYSLYPFVFQLPDGRLSVHANRTTRFLNPTLAVTPEALTAVYPHPRTYDLEGTSVLLPLLPDESPPYRARLMLIGGGGPPPANLTTPATNSCETLDLGAAGPKWSSAAAMAHPRVMPDAVLLPDGTVLVVNGSLRGKADVAVDPVFEAEIYHPGSDSWAPMCSARVPRLYHATALLLPDGRVLTAGTDEEFNQPPFNYPELRVEVFSPPYLFKGTRPQIADAPAKVGYGAGFEVKTPDAAGIDRAALIRPAAVTHSFNMAQRYVGLAIAAKTAGGVTLTAPPGPQIAPPGHYLLFVLNGVGVPSIGRFLQLA